MSGIVVICCCASSAAIGAFVAIYVEINKARQSLRSAVEDSANQLSRFVLEHNAMAKKIMAIDEKATNAQNMINLSTINNKVR